MTIDLNLCVNADKERKGKPFPPHIRSTIPSLFFDRGGTIRALPAALENYFFPIYVCKVWGVRS